MRGFFLFSPNCQIKLFLLYCRQHKNKENNLANLRNRRITTKEAEEIRSFAKKRESAFRVLRTVFLSIETDKWLRALSSKLKVSKGAIIRYFISKCREKIDLAELVRKKAAFQSKFNRLRAQVEKEITDHQKWCKFKSRRSMKGPLDRVGKDFCWTFEPKKYRKARLEDGVSAKDAQNNFEVGHEYT